MIKPQAKKSAAGWRRSFSSGRVGLTPRVHTGELLPLLRLMMVVVVSTQYPRPSIPEISIIRIPLPGVMVMMVDFRQEHPGAAAPAISIRPIPSRGMMVVVVVVSGRHVILGELKVSHLHLGLVVLDQPCTGVRYRFKQVSIGRRRRNGAGGDLANHGGANQKSRGRRAGQPECFRSHGHCPSSDSCRCRPPGQKRLLQNRNNFNM